MNTWLISGPLMIINRKCTSDHRNNASSCQKCASHGLPREVSKVGFIVSVLV